MAFAIGSTLVERPIRVSFTTRGMYLLLPAGERLFQNPQAVARVRLRGFGCLRVVLLDGNPVGSVAYPSAERISQGHVDHTTHFIASPRTGPGSG